AALHSQLEGIPDARRRVIRIQLDSPQQLSFGARPVKVTAKDSLPQRRMRLSQERINRNRGGSCLVSRRSAFAERQHTEDAEPVIVLSHTGISDCVVRIEGDGLVITN